MPIKKSDTADNKRKEIKYDVIEECGILSEHKNGNVIKLRYLSWNDQEPKYDIRLWKMDEEGNEVCGKGISLTGDELEALGKIILSMMQNN